MGVQTLDNQLMALPMAQGMWSFAKGATAVSQWTGCKSKQLMEQIGPIVVGDLGPWLGRLVFALMNFMFQAHALILAMADLEEMEANHTTFHELKDMLIVSGVYELRD